MEGVGDHFQTVMESDFLTLCKICPKCKLLYGEVVPLDYLLGFVDSQPDDVIWRVDLFRDAGKRGVAEVRVESEAT